MQTNPAKPLSLFYHSFFYAKSFYLKNQLKLFAVRWVSKDLPLDSEKNGIPFRWKKNGRKGWFVLNQFENNIVENFVIEFSRVKWTKHAGECNFVFLRNTIISLEFKMKGSCNSMSVSSLLYKWIMFCANTHKCSNIFNLFFFYSFVIIVLFLCDIRSWVQKYGR